MAIYDHDRITKHDGSAGIFENYHRTPAAEVASGSGSSLDPEQKTTQKPAFDANTATLVYRKHQSAVEHLHRWVIDRCTDEHLAKRILSCGTDAWIDCSPSTGRYRLRCTRCGFRACPICRAKWAIQKRERMELAIADVKPSRRKLCTLTLRSSSAPLKTQIVNLWKAFTRLRNRKLWKESVRGCIAVLEVTYNEARSQWHPHIHCVLDASFIDQSALSRTWLQVTRTSKIVDIRSIRSFESVARYLTKYLLKTVALPVDVNPEHQDELFDLHRKCRFIRWTGTLRPNLDEEPWKATYPTDWQPYAPLTVVVARVDAGELRAIAIIDAVRSESRYEQCPYTLDDG